MADDGARVAVEEPEARMGANSVPPRKIKASPEPDRLALAIYGSIVLLPLSILRSLQKPNWIFQHGKTLVAAFVCL